MYGESGLVKSRPGSVLFMIYMSKIQSILLCAFLLATSFLSAQSIEQNDQLNYIAPAVDDGEMLIDFANDETPSAIDTLLGHFGLGSGDYSLFSQEERWVRVQN